MKIKFKQTDYSELSTMDLLAKKKTTVFVSALLGGVLALLFIITIFQSITEGFKALSAVPFALLPILAININEVNSLNKELKSRELGK